METPAPHRAPEVIVERQLEAYNRHDVEAFTALFAPDVRIYNYPGQLLMEGRAVMRERYARLFTERPSIRAEIVNRTVLGHVVVDHERSHPFGEGGEMFDIVVIYVVEDGLIERVEFVRA